MPYDAMLVVAISKFTGDYLLGNPNDGSELCKLLKQAEGQVSEHVRALASDVMDIVSDLTD